MSKEQIEIIFNHKVLQIKILIILVGLFFTSVSRSQDNTFIEKLDSLDCYFEKMLKDWSDASGFAIGIVKDTSIVFLKGYGYRDVEKKLLVDENTKFGLASVSKGFTSLAIGVLQDEAILNIDEPIVNYLPEFSMYTGNLTKRITLKDMISHRTGLPRHPIGWIVHRDRQYLFKALPYLEPTYDLREKFQYTNIMFNIAGYIGEKMAGLTFEDIVKKKLLIPLKMQSTVFYSEELFDGKNVALPYSFNYKTDKLKLNIAEMKHASTNEVNPSGGLFSSAGDMCNYLIMNLNNGFFRGRSVVSENYLKEAHSIHVGDNTGGQGLLNLGYGLGWFIQNNNGNLIISHTGGGFGYGARVTLIPSKRIGFVVMTSYRNNFDYIIQRMLLDAIFEQEYFDWSAFGFNRWRKRWVESSKSEEHKDITANFQPIVNPHRYEGNYRHPAYGAFRLYLEKNSLMGIYDDEASFELKLDSSGNFSLMSKNEVLHSREVKFNVNSTGVIEELAIKLNPFIDPILFQRIVE